MSRSNPSEGNPNPSRRWFEWAGGSDGGFVRYYDKESGKTVAVDLPFTFILLDELAAVKGWHDGSDSGIFSNEVRDTKQDVMIVRAFKGGELASGQYSSIRDRVQAMGGHFVSSNYIAFKDGDSLQIGNLAFKGAALSAWMEFKKACKSKQVDGKMVRSYYTDAVTITGFNEGQKGRVVYRTPVFQLKPLSPESNAQAVALDQELQAYLSDYLKRPKAEQAQKATQTHDAYADSVAAEQPEREPAFIDDEVPF